MSVDQKDAAVRPLVSSATECIARTVSADPRLPMSSGAEFNDLIVESVPSCVDDLRSMIDAYDRLYGEGAGETFFMGPYLDGLPAAVTTRVKDAADAQIIGAAAADWRPFTFATAIAAERPSRRQTMFADRLYLPMQRRKQEIRRWA